MHCVSSRIHGYVGCLDSRYSVSLVPASLILLPPPPPALMPAAPSTPSSCSDACCPIHPLHPLPPAAQVVQAVLDSAITTAAQAGSRISQETLNLGVQPADVRSSVVSLQVRDRGGAEPGCATRRRALLGSQPAGEGQGGC